MVYTVQIHFHDNAYFSLQKLQLTGARQSQFLLWKVNKNTLWEHVLDEMFHAALNLSLRVAHELEQEKEVCYAQLIFLGAMLCRKHIIIPTCFNIFLLLEVSLDFQ